MVKPSAFRQAVGFLRGEFEMSERRACTVLGFRRSSCRYVPSRTMVKGLLDEIRAHAVARPRFGQVADGTGSVRVRRGRLGRSPGAPGFEARVSQPPPTCPESQDSSG